MTRYGVAIVGTGGIAEIHARDLATLGPRARLVAAVDIDPGRLAAFADRWSVPHRFADLTEMLGQVRPDLVHLCTPPGLHREQAVTCLAAGATVLCEKPPALSLAELDEVAAVQAAGGQAAAGRQAAGHGQAAAGRQAAGRGHFATVFQHRFGSGVANLRRMMAGGLLGRPTTAVCHTLWYRPDEYFAVPWRGSWEVEGGGPTMGHGIHQMDLLLAVLGPWREVVAVAGRLARPTSTEDFSAALVTFADGTVATVVNSLLSPRQTSYLRFDFDRATVEVEHLYGYDDTAWRVTPVPDPAAAGIGDAWLAGPVGQPSGHAAQFRAVCDALDAGTAPPVTLADAYATLELVAAIYASAFTGERVRRGQIGPDSPFYRRMDGSGAPWSAAGSAPAIPPERTLV